MKYIIILLLSIVSADECRNDAVAQYSFYPAGCQEENQVVEGKKECSVLLNFLKQVLFLDDNGGGKFLSFQNISHSKHSAFAQMNRKEIFYGFFLQHVFSGLQKVNSFLFDKYTSGYYTVGLRKLVI